ncbi:MAG: hypothetical protein S4CHLAM6_08280 [Chlamydiae bacterium]|nr:hypothetical protein [Chlamydiota bacterium]
MVVNGYLSNQLGFSETGRFVLENLIKPKAEEAGINVLDPIVLCGETINFEKLSKLHEHEKVVEFWKDFNNTVTGFNNNLMKESSCMLAILDGGHAVDDGVASEIGYYAAKEFGPIFALRSDFRQGENLATKINPQLIGYITESGGQIVEGENAVEHWAALVNDWAQTQFKPADCSIAS